MDSTTIERITTTAEIDILKSNFGNTVKYFAPGLKHYEIPEFVPKNKNAFLPISLTGKGCALECDHCDKKILEPMIPLDYKRGLFEMAKTLQSKGTEALLVSGGSMKNGQVPLLKHLDQLQRIKKELGMKIIMHTGLVSDEMAKGLRDAGIDGVALDIIGHNKTIKEVYHLDLTTEDYDQSLYLLDKYGLSTRPHIILGLQYGEMLGEDHALDMISKYKTHALILVILTPMQDTKMWGVTPPPVPEVEAFFKRARHKMPNTKILLGCARPGGPYKKQVDFAAIRSGLNGIAYPAQGVIEYASKYGLIADFYDNACSCGVE